MDQSDNQFTPPTLPDQPGSPPPEVPVFHNPLASSHEAHTAGLPPVAEPVAAEPTPTPPPSVADLQSQSSPPSGIPPAPVRLAPMPGGNQLHANALAAEAHATPFRESLDTHAAAAADLPLPARPPRRGSWGPRVIIMISAVVIILVAALYAYQLMQHRTTKPKATPTPSSNSIRDTSQKNLDIGFVRTQTDCFIIETPQDAQIQLNRDCRFSLVYGADKSSSIVISPYKDFDLVGAGETPTTSGQQSTFDSKKILDGLIASTTAGRTVSERTDITVGNIPTVKIITTGSTPAESVAYAFIVLPQTDQQFAEKTFIAFIVTGAYKDDTSRQVFNNLLQNWQWQ